MDCFPIFGFDAKTNGFYFCRCWWTFLSLGVEGGSYAAIRPFCAFGLLLFGSPVVALNVVLSARRLFLKMLNSSLLSSLFTLSLTLGKAGLTFPPDFRDVGSVLGG